MVIQKRAALLCFAVLALLSGCSSYKTIELGNNVKAYQIYCSGLPFSSVQDCYDRADYICGDGGYTILKENDPAYPHAQYIFDLTTHDALVRCNVPTPPSVPYSPNATVAPQ